MYYWLFKKIIKSNIDSFNINTLKESNIKQDYETPILVLLENNENTLISVVSTNTDMNKALYFQLDTETGYGIYEDDKDIYIQNNNKNYLIKDDGSIIETTTSSSLNQIIPAQNDNPRGFCFTPDCNISNEQVEENYEFILQLDHFNYKDYKTISFIRLCK